MARKILLLGVLLLWTMTGLVAVSPAQEDESEKPPKIIETLVVNIRPGMDPQYEAYVKKAIAAYKKTGSPQQWTAYRRYAGGDVYDYVFVWEHEKWAELDELMAGGDVLAEVYGEEEAKRIVKSGRDAIQHVTRTIEVERPDMSLQ